MAASVTVTGKTMGAVTVTAKTITNVRLVSFDEIRQMLYVTDNSDFVQEYDISACTTITCTVANGTYAFTIS